MGKDRRGSIDSILVMLVMIPIIVYLMIFFISVILHYSNQIQITMQTHQLAKTIARSGRVDKAMIEGFEKRVGRFAREDTDSSKGVEYKIKCVENNNIDVTIKHDTSKEGIKNGIRLRGGSTVSIYVSIGNRYHVGQLLSVFPWRSRGQPKELRNVEYVEVVVQKWWDDDDV